jgi:Kef-type K+ transport system membrane component KefB
MLSVLSTLGIIILFVYSGLEVDTKFISNHKLFFIKHIAIHFVIFLLVGYLVNYYLQSGWIIAFMISLALTTPSASYIISSIKGHKFFSWIESKAIAGEILSLLLLIILRRADNLNQIIYILLAIAGLIILLPFVLRILYRYIFSKLVGTEFTFIFVVAVISAFVTEFIGLHFLVGAFIAGMVSRTFVNEIIADKKYTHITPSKGKQIIVGFNFFVLTFTPFFFFVTGLKINTDAFQLHNLLFAFLMAVLISLIKIVITSLHRTISFKEKFSKSSAISVWLTPTLVFTFVIADILKSYFIISVEIYNTLLLYGLFTALISLVLEKLLSKKAVAN